MKINITNIFTLIILIIISSCLSKAVTKEQELKYWNNTENTNSILNFIESVTDIKSSDYLVPEKRIAVFDMDGTVLCERPGYSEVDMSIEYVKRQLMQNPELSKLQPYKAVLENDKKYLKDSVEQVLLTPFIGYSQEQYKDSVISFFNSNKHPKFNLYYKDLFYAPMVELIKLLKKNDFKVYISSYSQQSFIRSLTTEYLGIDNEHSIGSIVDLNITEDKTKFVRDDNFILKNKYKAEILEYQIGMSPIFVVGNSDGDLEMLEHTNTIKPHKIIILNHNDSIREYKYAKKNLLNIAKKNNWNIISMKDDFKIIFK